jgi:hypothetical protein
VAQISVGMHLYSREQGSIFIQLHNFTKNEIFSMVLISVLVYSINLF